MESYATVIIYCRQILPKSGTELTLQTCISKNKPYLLIDMNVFDIKTSANSLMDFVQKYKIKKLNFGGPRESVVNGIQEYTKNVVECFVEIIGLSK